MSKGMDRHRHPPVRRPRPRLRAWPLLWPSPPAALGVRLSRLRAQLETTLRVASTMSSTRDGLRSMTRVKVCANPTHACRTRSRGATWPSRSARSSSFKSASAAVRRACARARLSSCGDDARCERPFSSRIPSVASLMARSNSAIEMSFAPLGPGRRWTSPCASSRATRRAKAPLVTPRRRASSDMVTYSSTRSAVMAMPTDAQFRPCAAARHLYPFGRCRPIRAAGIDKSYCSAFAEHGAKFAIDAEREV